MHMIFGIKKETENLYHVCRAFYLICFSSVSYTHLVTDIGMQTEVGKIAGLLKSTSEKQTPLQVSLEAVSYTHLDVYKRQVLYILQNKVFMIITQLRESSQAGFLI